MRSGSRGTYEVVWVVGVEAPYKGIVGGVVHAPAPILVHVHGQEITRLKGA